MNDLVPIAMPDVKYTVDTEMKQDQLEIEIDTNTMYFHLTDHDYINMKPRTWLKKKKKPIKITKLRAIYNCTACGYHTMERDALQYHMCTKPSKSNNETTKILPKAYETCSKCSYYTNNKQNFIQHTKLHVEHTKKHCTECTSPKLNVNMDYQCSKCNYTTKNLRGLKIHMHRHSQGTIYKCTECLFAGSDLKALVKHYEDVKDLQCSCGYATHVKQHMKKHLRSHTGEKPFSCGICNFSWSDRAGLHRHMNKKHVLQFE